MNGNDLAGAIALLGEFLNEKLNAADEGAVSMSVISEKDVVKLTFTKPVAWIGITPEGAIELAETLISHARACGSKKPLTIKIT